MSKLILIALLAIAVILCVVMISGCSEEKQADTPVYNFSMPAYGHVYLDGKAVSGALVTAVSVDGASRASNVTNDSGAYVLYLVPWNRYNVTATYQGLKQRLRPVYLHNLTGGYIVNEDIADRYDIDLTKTPKTTITGVASYGPGSPNPANGVFIVATPADGSAPLTTVTGEDGTYSFDLKPGVSYGISGKYSDYYGQHCGIQFAYRNDDYCNGLTLQQGETALVDIRVLWVHPPKGLYYNLSGKIGTITSIPALPTTMTGHVYLDGKGVKGATVEAINLERGGRTTTVTDDSGRYSLGLNTTTLYRITAVSQGLQHSIGPIFLENNVTEAHNINLTGTPISSITGRPPENEPWLARPGEVTIEAVPQYDGSKVKTVTDTDLSYSLELEPFLYYNLTGQFRDANGAYHAIEFASSTGVVMSEVMVRPNETVTVDYFTSVAYY